MPDLGERGALYMRASIHALLGEKDEALAVLRHAIDSGWRAYWIEQPYLSPGFAPLRGDPEFEALMDEVKELIADDLRRVREMEQSGLLSTAPE